MGADVNMEKVLLLLLKTEFRLKWLNLDMEW